MSGNSFGKFFKVHTFGESRSAGLGAVIDGCPAGLSLNEKIIQDFLNRRKPNQHAKKDGKEKSNTDFSTKRKENDSCKILSGVFEEKTLGTPIAVIVENSETSDKDYSNLKDIYRPGHADYAYEKKYGFRDYRGGGRSSGRETIGRVIGGAIAKAFLDAYAEKNNIKPISINLYATEIAGLKCKLSESEEFPNAVFEKLKEIKQAGDSAGCVLEVQVANVPEGLGSPVFDKLDAVLAQAMMSIGAVKGFQVGGGFNSAAILGSQNNDLSLDYSGGITGGISACGKASNIRCQEKREDASQKLKPTLCNLNFSLAIKPPPSILAPQKAYTKAGELKEITIRGNHDVCLFPRIAPVVEAMCYIVLADAILASRLDRI